MSTKTLRKRVALATVVALGAGVLSLVSSTSANAAPNVAAGTASTGTPTYGVLNIGTGSSTTGAAVLSNAGASGNLSAGLVNVSDIAGGLNAGTTTTAVLLSTGQLAVYTTGDATTTDAISVVVTGGRITNTAGWASATLNAGATAISQAGTAAGQSGNVAVAITPNSGATSVTVQLYNATSTTASAQANAPTSGTLVGQIVVTIASSSTAGTASLAKSGVYYVTTYNAGSTTSDATTPAAKYQAIGTSSYDLPQWGQFRVRDAYGTAVTLTGGLLQITATNGALVKLNPGASTTVGTASTDFSTSASDAWDYVVSAPSNAPVSTTVTVTYNGTVIGTKAYVFTGAVAKITLSSPVNGKISNTTSNTASIVLADSAGNTLYTSYAGTATAATPSANLSANSALTSSTGVSNVAWGTAPSITNAGVATAGTVQFTCSSTAGATNIGVVYTNNDGTVITSNTLPVLCAGAAVTYTAALDKKTYVPGDIATLTFTFKDSKGNLANDIDAVSASGKLISWNGSQISTAVTGWTPASAYPWDVASNGVIKLKYIVGSTTGNYTGIADVPALDSSSTPQAAVTLSYSISDGSTSLNDVLKGIVSLIASINKQIAALAKLVAPAKKK